MIQFRLFGIPVTVLPWFWLTMAFLGYAFSGGATTAAGLIRLGLFILAGFISILVHELGHALMVRLFKAPTQIVLQAFGGYATHPAGIMTRLQSFLITAAGPAIQIVLGAAAVAVLIFAPVKAEHAQFFIYILALISIVWALFNFLPIYPLDGGQMLHAVLGERRVKVTLGVSIFLGGLLAVVAFFYRQPFAAMFMAFFTWQNVERLRSRGW